MQTELYKVFYTVAKFENISKAADALFISQPAISKAIKNLEQETGCILFRRHAKGVTLTTEGQLLYEHVEKAFLQLERGQQLLGRLKSLEEGVLRFGISNTLCKYYLMPHLRTFHESYPQIKIEIINRTSSETLALLSAGHLDFGILSQLKVLEDFCFLPLLKIQDIFVSNKKELATCEPYTPECLLRLPLLLLEKHNTSRKAIDQYFYGLGITCIPELEIGSMEFLIEFARMGMGVAAVLRQFVEIELSEGLLFELPLQIPLPFREIGILYQGDYPQSKAMTAFIEHLKRKI